MGQELQEESPTGINAAELRQLLGPAPVLRSESARSYDEILGRLMACLKPRDFMEQMLVKDLTDCTWEIARYTRQKTLTMERGFFQHLGYPGHEKVDRLREQGRDPASASDPQQGDDLIEKVDPIELEFDHAFGLRGSIGYHERLDRLLITATARRNNVLEQIEGYRNGLGEALQQVSDTIIAAQFDAVEAQPRQIAAPPLVPSEEQQQ